MIAHLTGRVLAYLLLALVAAFGIAPFAIMLLISFKTRIEVLEVPPSLDFDWAVIKENYDRVINERGFLTYTVNSVIVTGATTLIALVLGVPAAYAFSRLDFRGANSWATTILSFRFMPPIAIVIPVFLLVRYLNLLDTKLGLVLPYVAFSLPLVVWIMIGFFDEISREIDEAARVDGCTRFGALWRVMLPLALPGIAVAAIFSVIFIWNEFLIGLFVVSTQSSQTVPIAAAGLLTAQRPIDWNMAATVGVVTVLPVFVFAIFVQRYIVRGITSGAVK